jgi:KipI family sensor histidine kinase inhibitor
MSRARIEPLGDQALVIDLGNTVDPEVNRRVCVLALRIQAAHIEAVVDIVPSFTAVAVHYLADGVRREDGEMPYEALVRRLQPLIDEPIDAGDEASGPVIDIPVCYGGEYGPDLEEAARLCKLTPETLIALHQQPEPLRVYMIGFAPGAPYIGLLDPRVSLPRRATPRVSVPAGTVAIAKRQSVIYPFAAPGGWNLIGRTPVQLFDPVRDPPGLLKPGTMVRFRAIDEQQLKAWPERLP